MCIRDRFRELYPQAHILPLDYDASLSRVNQENRIKLLLTDAREKMTQTDPAPVPAPAAPGLASSFCDKRLPSLPSALG